MTNKILNPLFTAITTCFLLLSSGCAQEPTSSSGLEHRSIYADNRTLETDSFILEAQKPECTDKIYNYQLRVYFDVTSKEDKKSQFITKGSHLVDETLGGEYKVQEYGDSLLELEPGVTGGLVFYANIPLSIKEHNYRFSFELRGYQIDYGLYDTPDELRTDWTLKYYASGKLVNTVKVRDGRGASRYVYESSDRLEYCENWYTDEAKTKYFGEPWTVNSDMNVYGDALPCFDWDTSSNPDYSIMKKCNHAPTDRKIMIPRYYDNKEIYIGRNAIRFSSGVDVIYIPITVRGIDDGNVNGLSFTAIYYEGSEEEWNAMYKGKPPVNLFFMNHDGFPY